MDAANILKPALARGNTIGATTLDEYKVFRKTKH
jgi:ATP-dependent Clp protease ATP-binding subunit ClpA